MSKLFEAIQKQQGEIAEAILPMIDAVPAPPPRPAPVRATVDEDEAAVRAVMTGGQMEMTPLPLPVPPPAAAPPTGEDAIRVVTLRLPGSAPLLPFDDTHPAAAEQYRIIRTKLNQHPRRPQLLLISSAGPSDGKSVTALNIAGALSLKSDAKILLADTDFRRSTIHLQLGLPAAPGLADVLSGSATIEDAVVRTAQFPNLYVVPAGEPRPNPSELLDSPRWTAFCSVLRERFRYVIADSPPFGSVADYDLLQASCDGVILVARPDHTKRQMFLKVLETIPKEKLIGVVMNCVEEWFLGRNEYYAPYYYGRQPRNGSARK